mmetsp:Transcript_38326/g.114750  ORF Transcript_38326/g.114750 Transcript_38326/m.114750 type:complete len:387 (-) Transcript_38326:1209-2369(-)
MIIGADIRPLLLVRSIRHGQFHPGTLVNRHESFGIHINPFLILGPKFAPLHIDDSTGGSLGAHERSECFDVDAATHRPPHRGHTRIVPTGNLPLFDEPRELPLGQHCVTKINPREFLDADATKSERTLNPTILLVPIIVFGGTQGVGDPLDGIDNGTRQVVGGVRLVTLTGTMMRRQILSVQYRIAHGTVHAAHVDPGPEAERRPLLGSRAHELEVFHRLGGGLIPMGRLDPVHTFLLHLLLGSIVHVGESVPDHPLGVSSDGLEVVTGVGHHVGLDAQFAQILQDGRLILLLLLGRVGIVEPRDESTLVPSGVVIVQEQRLGVSDVKVSRGFGGEAGDDLTGGGPLQRVHPLDQRFEPGSGVKDRLGLRDSQCQLGRLAEGGVGG